MLYSESLVRFAYHRRFGKVDPTSLSSTWNFAAQLAEDEDPAATFNQAMAAGSLADFENQHLRRGPLYRYVKAALAQFRAIAAAGGWGRIPRYSRRWTPG